MVDQEAPQGPAAAAAFSHHLGPRDAKVMIVGDAWGKDDAKVGRPFNGYSGQMLGELLTDAGLRRRDCFLTTVFARQAPARVAGKHPFHSWQLTTKEAKAAGAAGRPQMTKGRFLSPQFFGELDRLEEEIRTVRPNVVVALGATAAWALLGVSGLQAVRGTCAEGLGGAKVLPTFHPSSLLAEWDNRVILVADLMKAERESHFPELRRPKRLVTIDPTLDEVLAFTKRKHHVLGVDIETASGQITCIGFAPSPDEALVVPFVDWRKESRSYWPAQHLEERAWLAVRELLAGPAEKVFQNGLYDMQWLAKAGCRLRNVADDTMLLHHALYPELPKGLGFLGSIYTSEASWKLLRNHKTEMNKREE